MCGVDFQNVSYVSEMLDHMPFINCTEKSYYLHMMTVQHSYVRAVVDNKEIKHLP